MDSMSIIFISFLCLSPVLSDKYETLLPLYEMEDYLSCLEEDGFYCKVDAKLTNNGNENNSMWNFVQESISEDSIHDRSIIHRGVCLNKKEVLNLDSMKHYSKLHINKKIKKINLLASVENIICTTKGNEKIYFYDKFLMFLLVAYICLILYATIYDGQNKTKTHHSTGDKIIRSLSLTSNWKKICSTKENEDYRKLKSIQGIRFYNMLLIIFAHTLLSFNLIYLSNPDDLRKMMRSTSMHYYRVLAAFVVQTFFLISSWILTYQIYNIYEVNGKFTVKQTLIFIVNRFFRIEVCVTVAILIYRSSWIRLLNGPIVFDINEMAIKACIDNWWQTFFFINNFLNFGNMCHPISWYLSVDFQLYILAVITIHLILKYQLNEFKVISFLILFSCSLYGSIIYFTKMDVIYRFDHNSLRKFVLSRSEPVRILYFSTFSNWTTSLVGISLGIVYTRNKNRNILNNKNRMVMSILWCLLFFGLPSTVIFVAGHTFNRVQSAILGALVKPLFSFGIGIGILGMSHNIGGITKWICENKYVLLLSNFSFCAYVFQSYVIFTKGIGIYSLMEFDPISMLKSFLFIDAPGSIMVGFICTLFFEQPGINLQKIFLPQVAERTEQPKKN